MEPHISRPPLWKQLLGAVAGATIALVLYGAYTVASPRLTAYLSIPWPGKSQPPSSEVRLPGNTPEDEQKRIAARARAIADRFTVRPSAAPATEELIFAEDEEESHEEEMTEEEKSAPSESAVLAAEPEAEKYVPVPLRDEDSDADEEESDDVPNGELEAALMHSEPDALPSSGVGTWLAAVFALLGAVALRFRKKLSMEIASL